MSDASMSEAVAAHVFGTDDVSRPDRIISPEEAAAVVATFCGAAFLDKEGRLLVCDRDKDECDGTHRGTEGALSLHEMRKIEGVAVRKFYERLTTQLLKTFPASAERTRFLAQLNFSSELIMITHGWLKP